jgi:hypothetical protein
MCTDDHLLNVHRRPFIECAPTTILAHRNDVTTVRLRFGEHVGTIPSQAEPNSIGVIHKGEFFMAAPKPLKADVLDTPPIDRVKDRVSINKPYHICAENVVGLSLPLLSHKRYIHGRQPPPLYAILKQSSDS